jgi:hypothetical protein
MLQDVAQCCIPKWGHCDLDLNCQGQIKVISGTEQNFFVLRHSAFIFCMYMYSEMTVLHIKIRSLWPWPLLSRSNKCCCFLFSGTECWTAQIIFESESKCPKVWSNKMCFVNLIKSSVIRWFNQIDKTHLIFFVEFR